MRGRNERGGLALPGKVYTLRGRVGKGAIQGLYNTAGYKIIPKYYKSFICYDTIKIELC